MTRSPAITMLMIVFIVFQGASGPVSSRTFASSHQSRAETWHHAEPVPIPLLSPNNRECLFSLTCRDKQ